MVQESRIKLFVATPLGSGQVWMQYALGLAGIAQGIGHWLADLRVGTATGCYVALNRAKLVHQFMASGCTHLFFIDSDQVFSPDQVKRLLDHDEEIVSGVYTLRNMRTTLPFEFEGDKHESKNLLAATRVPTGFLCIKRSAIEKMVAKWPHLQHNEHVHVFECLVDHERREWTGEDFTFAKRWISMGERLWVDPSCPVGHMGMHNFMTPQHSLLHAVEQANQPHQFLKAAE